jgi:pimeloyl-ACP methyl ester carboxylesterase
LKSLFLTILFQFLLSCFVSAGQESWVVRAGGMEVPFHAWSAGSGKVSEKGSGILVLVPGYNGAGQDLLDGRWKAFAEKHDLVLLAPSFQAVGDENNRGKGYYYPEQGSGAVLEKALEDVKARMGARFDQVLIFGFSAGAHFGHRFALWKPQRVKAFVAYSAGWWSEPNKSLRAVPALILCGEADERFAASYEFFMKGHRLGCPWIWRGYKETGHVLSVPVREMAEVFLAHYAEKKLGADLECFFGDFQSYQTYPKERREEIQEEFRILLPSLVIAETWKKEGAE